MLKKMWSMWCLVVISLILSALASADVSIFDFSNITECNFIPASQPKNITKLAKKFMVKVEGKLSPMNYFDSDGYYDAEGDRGATSILNQGVRSWYFYDFSTGKAFDVKGHSCSPDNLYQSGCNPYALFIAELAAHHNVSDECQLYGGDIVYTGIQSVNDTVRGILVEKWSQCVHDYRQNLTYVSHYYYTAPNVSNPSSPKDSVPVRFETHALNATGLKNNGTYVYDFTYYMPEVLDDSVFLPPAGVYCPGWARENKTLPLLPEQFSLTMLTVSLTKHEVHSIKLNFDYNNKLVSFITDALNGTHFPPVHAKNRTLYRIVHDYNTNLSFSMPVEAWLLGGGSCKIDAINTDSLEWRSDNSTDIHLRQARELFGMGRKGWTYVGERNFNELPTSVWINKRNVSNEITITEVYWLNETWTTSIEPVFAGLITYRTNASGFEETYRTIVSDYQTFPFHWRTFMVDSCLKSDSQQMVTFTVGVNNYTEVALNVASFETGIRNALASLTGATPVRFTDISVEKGFDPNTAQIWLTILDWNNKASSGNLGSVAQPSVQEIVDGLKKKFDDTDFVLNVTYAGNTEHEYTLLTRFDEEYFEAEPITLQKGTLQNGSDLVKPTAKPVIPTTSTPPAPMPQPITQEGYTGGSMAGLAIAMIIIGGVAGLVAGFLLWKRNTGIAYQVYD